MSFTCAAMPCSNGSYRLNKWKRQLCDICGCKHMEIDCKCDPPFRLFPFPTQFYDSAQREKWKLLIGRQSGQKLWSPAKDSRVCSEHFVDGRPTEKNPLPTLKLGYKDVAKRLKRMSFFQDPEPKKVKKPYVIILENNQQNDYHKLQPGKKVASTVGSELGVRDISSTSLSVDSSHGERLSRTERTAEKGPSIHAIQGLPINVPFILDFKCPSSQSMHQSEPYILIKYSAVCEQLPERPFKVKVKENVVEVDKNAGTDEILYNLTVTNSAKTMISPETDQNNVIQSGAMSKPGVSLLAGSRDRIANQLLKSHLKSKINSSQLLKSHHNSKTVFTSKHTGVAPKNRSDIPNVNGPVKVGIDNTERKGCTTDSVGLSEHGSETTVTKSTDKETQTRLVVIRVKSEPEDNGQHEQIATEFLVQRNTDEQSHFTHSNKKTKLGDNIS